MSGPGNGETPSRDYLAHVLHSLSSGVVALDSEGRVVMANRAAAQHLRLPEETVALGRHFSEVFGLQPFVEAVEAIMADGSPVSRREIVVTFDDGRRMELGLTASVIEGAGDFSGVLLQFADITERRNLERAAELSRQLATLGELTAGVVHELRNPVSVISGMAELLMRRMPPDDPRRDSAATIVEEAASIERSISQFLSFARPFDLEMGHCAPGEVAERALQLCRHRAERRHVRTAYEPGLATCTLRADVNRAAQAVANVLNNAIDVSEPGDVVELRLRQEDGDAVFEVLDSGPGVHVAPGEDLFSPFFTKKDGGTGLGLSIVHRIATAHGGAVRYSNRAEGGARFEILLPLEEPGPDQG